MPTYGDGELWEVLAQYLGEPVPESVRQVFVETALVASYQSARPRENALARMKELSLSLRRHGLWDSPNDTIREASPESPAGQKDERWELWNDLRRQAGVPDDWAPLTVSRVFDESAGAALPSQRVEISFDSRMPLSVLIGRIRGLWPRLSGEGWVQATRRSERRAVAYIRHVCLDNPPDTPWRQLLDSWNAAYPQWSHRDPRTFHSAFVRAEKQLTGERYGLEWFYSTIARDPGLRWRLFAQQELLHETTGLRWAQRHFLHRDGRWEHNKDWLFRMARFQRRAQELIEQGLEADQVSGVLSQESDEWREIVSHQPGAELVEGLLAHAGQFPDTELGEWRVDRARDAPSRSGD